MVMPAHDNGLVIDEFAGGGGASLGISRAIERDVDIAVNHDAGAVEMHRINHPRTRHFQTDVFKLDPIKVCKGRSVWFAWFSPDCRHFSRAKGAKPVSRRVRGLARIACIWAKKKRPKLIFLENVREFQDWGPLIQKLDEAGRPLVDIHSNPVLIPDPTRKGKSFKRFVARFVTLGYAVEWRDLDAADYGAPTHRRRLFLIARCDGLPITWPARTHAPADKCAALGLLPYRSAAECIDWSIPCPSIFEKRQNGKYLVKNTNRRIAYGFMRYVAECADPYIVTCNHAGNGFRGSGIREPMKTITGSRDAHGVVIPYVIQCKSIGRDLRKPAPASCASNHHMLIAPWIIKHFGGAVGADIRRPLPTTTRRGTQNQVAAAYLVHLNHGEKQWSNVRDPMRTATTGKHAAVVSVSLIPCDARAVKWYQAHYPNALKVYGFLIKYYGACEHGQSLFEPMHTLTGKDRFALVQVTVDGDSWIVADIGMRMLIPRELARAQGFPDGYVLTGNIENQVARIGNSVCPIMAEVIVRANVFAAAKVVEVAA